MIDSDVREILDSLSTVTQAIGRQLKSPRLDVDDLNVLIDALEGVTNALTSLGTTMMIRHPNR
jgi:ABC-type transporter Mla subunit MlaD